MLQQLNDSEVDYFRWFLKRGLALLFMISSVLAILVGAIILSPPPRYQTISWLATQGLITRSALTACSGGGYLLDVAYVYSVNGRTYTGSGLGPESLDMCVSQDEAADLLKPFPVGPKQVWYERKNPARSSLFSMENVSPRPGGWKQAWGFFVAAFILLLACWGIVRWSGQPPRLS